MVFLSSEKPGETRTVKVLMTLRFGCMKDGAWGTFGKLAWLRFSLEELWDSGEHLKGLRKVEGHVSLIRESVLEIIECT